MKLRRCFNPPAERLAAVKTPSALRHSRESSCPSEWVSKNRNDRKFIKLGSFFQNTTAVKTESRGNQWQHESMFIIFVEHDINQARFNKNITKGKLKAWKATTSTICLIVLLAILLLLGATRILLLLQFVHSSHHLHDLFILTTTHWHGNAVLPCLNGSSITVNNSATASLFCCPPLMPCSFKMALRSMIACFTFSNSWKSWTSKHIKGVEKCIALKADIIQTLNQGSLVSAGLKPALSFLISFLASFFVTFVSSSIFVSTGASGFSAALVMKLPNLGSRPFAILQAST